MYEFQHKIIFILNIVSNYALSNILIKRRVLKINLVNSALNGACWDVLFKKQVPEQAGIFIAMSQKYRTFLAWWPSLLS